MNTPIDNNTNGSLLSELDYSTKFSKEREKYLLSKRWEKIALAFIRTIKQQVADGDVEELKKHLRLKRLECLDEFKKCGVYYVWDKCFRRETQSFDVGLFISKLEAISEDGIDAADLEPVFDYYCLTENIDKLLRQIFAIEKKNSLTTVNQYFIKNLALVNGTINVGGRDAENQAEEEEEEILKNLIFNNLFDSNARLHKLRDEIARSIDMGDYNNVYGSLERKRIDPTRQSEWYYILKAICESEVAIKRFSVELFIEQMIIWYPWLFEDFPTLDSKKSFKKRLIKSISHEKGLWKKGSEETPIKDMWARYKALSIDYYKVDRVQPICKILKDALTNLKSDIEKENNKQYK